MRTNANTPAQVREAIGAFLIERGFASLPLEPLPQMRPHDNLVFAREDQRIAVACYAKYGIVRLYVRTGLRLPIDDAILAHGRRYAIPRESADLEYLVGAARVGENNGGELVLGGVEIQLPKQRAAAEAIVHRALELALSALVPEGAMIRTLLAQPETFNRKAKLTQLGLPAMRLACAEHYLEGDERARVALACLEAVRGAPEDDTPHGTLAREVLRRASRYAEAAEASKR